MIEKVALKAIRLGVIHNKDTADCHSDACDVKYSTRISLHCFDIL